MQAIDRELAPRPSRRDRRRRRLRRAVRAAPAARRSASAFACSSRARESAGRGTGTAIPAPAATSSRWTTPTRSRRSSSRNGSGPSATRPSRRSCGTSTTSPTASTCAATSSSSTRVVRRRDMTPRQLVGGHDGGRSSILGDVLHHGLRVPVDAAPARDRRARRLRRRLVPQRALAARRRRARRQARRRDRHRLDRHPADPAASPSRQSTCTCSSGRANFSMPAHNRPLDPDAQRAIKAATASGGGSRASRSAACRARIPMRCRSARRSRLTPEERARAYERGWAKGGIGGITLAFNDINVNAEANATAADFVRDKIREIVRDPATARGPVPDRRTRSAPSASASTPTTTRPTTATT